MKELPGKVLKASFGVCRTLWRIVYGAVYKYVDTDGEQRAASFAYYAIFALFPLLVLLVSVGTVFVDQQQVTLRVVEIVSRYLPTVNPDDMSAAIHTALTSRRGTGALALIAIGWSSLGFFHALVRGVNRAWGSVEYPWWKLPFTNLFMVAIVASALVLGVLIPAILDSVEAFAGSQAFFRYGREMLAYIITAMRHLVPTLVLFYGFSMFYKFAPRRRTGFSEIWVSALTVTVLLQALQNLFVLYVTTWSNMKSIYGAFGSVVAVLLWIYLSGSIIIFGGCLSAAQAEVLGRARTTEL